jgi:iron complex transport system substrate-binding protein
MSTGLGRSLLAGGLTGLLAIAGCAAGPSAPRPPASAATPAAGQGSASALSVSNCGRELTFAGPPTRIVSLYPPLTELLLALGAKGQIVGQAGLNQAPPREEFKAAIAAIPVISKAAPSTEALLAARPQLLIAEGDYHFDGKRLPTIDDLKARGIQVYIDTAHCPGRKIEGKVTDAYTDMANLGRLLGDEHGSAVLTEEQKRKLADVATRLAGRDPVRTALVTVYDKSLYVDAGGVYTDVLTLAGGENVTQQGEMPPGEYYAQVSAEVVAKKNPDAIVFTYLDEESRSSSEQWLREAFAATAAVRNDRLIAIPEAVFSGGLRSFPGVAELATALHPDAFRS